MGDKVLRNIGWKLAFLFLLAIPISIGFIFSSAVAADWATVSVYADNAVRTIQSEVDTVEQALQKAGIELREDDLVEPSLNTPINDPVFSINVYRARPVVVVDGKTKRIVNSPYQSARLVAADAGIIIFPEDNINLERIENFLEEKVLGQRLSIDRATPVQINLYGAEFTHRTHAETIKDMLKEMEVSLSKQDILLPGRGAEISKEMKVEILRIGQDVRVKQRKIAFNTEIIRDSSKPAGYREVITPGKKGIELLVVKKKNNKILQVVTKRLPVKEVVVIGVENDITDDESLLAALRQCEAGGDYRRNSGNGFYGAYQFLGSTWARWNTGYARADLAPPEVQDATVLKNARASTGGFWSQHPGCSEKLGLPQFPF